MPRPLTPEQIESILTMRALPQRTISKRVGCSLGMVSKVLGMKPGKTTKTVKPVVAVEPDAVEAAAALVASGSTDLDELDAILERLSLAADIALADRDPSRIVAVAKARAQTISQRADARPVPIADPNAEPETRKQAHAFRDRVSALLDRLIDERDA
ncbi:hypothetical protein BH11MYX4_BH11MYX4_41950 [soil metagenome]